MSNKNYYDFAENDYLFVLSAYEAGGTWNSMCSLAQKVCERFLKHLIEQYYIPNNEIEVSETESVMKAHNLNKIEKFIKDHTDINIDSDTHNALKNVNGYYYETSYPGDESYFVDKEDIDIAVKSMKICKEFTDQTILKRSANKSLSETKPTGNGEGGDDGDADGTDSFGSSDGKSHSGSGDDTADSDDWTGLDEP